MLYGVYTTNNTFVQKTNINVGDVKRLIRVLECLDDEQVTLSLEDNALKYKSKSVKFKYHLLEDVVMQHSGIKPEKINSFKFNTEFEIPNRRIQEVLKGSSFAVDINKIYLYTQDTLVMVDIADLATPLTDSIGFEFAEAFAGTPILTPIPLHLDSIRLLAGVKFNSVKVKVNTELSVVLFELTTPNTVLKYIISSRVR
jgi:hypothetical protein